MNEFELADYLKCPYDPNHKLNDTFLSFFFTAEKKRYCEKNCVGEFCIKLYQKSCVELWEERKGGVCYGCRNNKCIGSFHCKNRYYGWGVSFTHIPSFLWEDTVWWGSMCPVCRSDFRNRWRQRGNCTFCATAVLERISPGLSIRWRGPGFYFENIIFNGWVKRRNAAVTKFKMFKIWALEEWGHVMGGEEGECVMVDLLMDQFLPIIVHGN